MKKHRFFYFVILLIAAAALVVADIWLKGWAAANLQGTPTQVLIPGLLGLTYHRNTGAAFGLLANFEWGRLVLIVVKVVLMGGLLWFYNRVPSGKKYWWLRVPIILIFAGGIGNLWDRITLGYVRDMLAFLFIDFPIFNLADVFVVTGCFLGAFVMLFVVRDFP